MIRLLSASIFAVCAAAAPIASAQAPKQQLRIVSASLDSAAKASGSSATNRWVCAASKGLEIAEVSGDVASDETRYVLLHRNAGEVVASERLSNEEVSAFERMGCAGVAGGNTDQAVG